MGVQSTFTSTFIDVSCITIFTEDEVPSEQEIIDVSPMSLDKVILIVIALMMTTIMMARLR